MDASSREAKHQPRLVAVASQSHKQTKATNIYDQNQNKSQNQNQNTELKSSPSTHDTQSVDRLLSNKPFWLSCAFLAVRWIMEHSWPNGHFLHLVLSVSLSLWLPPSLSAVKALISHFSTIHSVLHSSHLPHTPSLCLLQLIFNPRHYIDFNLATPPLSFNSSLTSPQHTSMYHVSFLHFVLGDLIACLILHSDSNWNFCHWRPRKDIRIDLSDNQVKLESYLPVYANCPIGGQQRLLLRWILLPKSD